MCRPQLQELPHPRVNVQAWFALIQSHPAWWRKLVSTSEWSHSPADKRQQSVAPPSVPMPAPADGEDAHRPPDASAAGELHTLTANDLEE
eukprot:5559708-Alexandrium_andersonii.AAC.1